MPQSPARSFGALALSTMWAQRFPASDLTPFLAAGRDMGFERFELGHALDRDAVNGFVPGSFQISAVHHPCPGDAARGSLLSPIANERAAAADSLSTSIRLADRLGAAAVVFHLGRAAGVAGELTGQAFELISRYRAGQSASARYREVRLRFADGVRKVEERALGPAADSLAAPLALAQSFGLVLAFETGHDPDELPTPAGARAFLSAAAAAGLRPWLDTGHVAAQEALRLATLTEWNNAVDGTWAGAHLHDAVGLRDHLPPGAGIVDLAAAMGSLPPGALLTLEVDWYLEPAEVAAGASRIASVIDNG